MNAETALRAEIRRFVAGAGSFATPHAVVEGLRNGWQGRLEPDGEPRGAFAKKMNAVMQSMVADGELADDGSGKLKARRVLEKPSGWISFAWTTEALLAGHKTVTRREWSDSYARRFVQGDLVHAYDKRPAWGGKPVALIRLTQTPYKQSTGKIPKIDWYNEGFAYLRGQGKKVDGKTPRELWDDWKDNPRDMWVVRFEVLELL